MKVLKRIIAIVVAIGIVAGLGFYKYLNTVTYYNEPGTNGNTIGNLYGNGLFCESDGVVYFSNPNDKGRIYKMNPDESDIEIVADAISGICDNFFLPRPPREVRQKGRQTFTRTFRPVRRLFSASNAIT